MTTREHQTPVSAFIQTDECVTSWQYQPAYPDRRGCEPKTNNDTTRYEYQ